MGENLNHLLWDLARFRVPQLTDAPARPRPTSAGRMASCAYQITGNVSQEYSIAQVLALSGSAGEVFTVGGWAKANAAPKPEEGTDRDFKLRLLFTAADNSEQWEEVPLNRYVGFWQYGTGTFLAKKDFVSVGVYFCYNHNCNTAWFDSVFLCRDTAQSYRYDGKGNLVSAADYAAQTSSFSYTGSDLSKLVSPSGTGFEYTYDANGNLISAHTSEGVTSSITYDSHGNPISSTVIGNEDAAALQSGKTYYIQMKSTGEYLTAGDTAGSQVTEVGFSWDTKQQWKLENATKGGFVLIPQNAAGMALTVAGGADRKGPPCRSIRRTARIPSASSSGRRGISPIRSPRLRRTMKRSSR